MTATSRFEQTPKQRELARVSSGPETYILAPGGSRSGKTFEFIYQIVVRALMAPGSNHLCLRKHRVNAVAALLNDTFKTVMRVAFPDVPYNVNKADAVVSIGRSQIFFGGIEDGDRADKILGREFATIFFDEASEIEYGSYSVALTRIAQLVSTVDGRQLPLRAYVALNPTDTTHWTHKLWIDKVDPVTDEPLANPEDYATPVFINPVDNTENLPAATLKILENLDPAKKRRFYLGEYGSDSPFALWRRSMIKRIQMDDLPEMQRIVVAVDPAVTNKVGSDETGIVVVGIGADGVGYVLDDRSGRMRVEEWGRTVLAAYRLWDADAVVAEVNQGGDLVERNVMAFRQAGEAIRYIGVRATRGKRARAEPIAALYDLGRVKHVGEYHILESQMCAFEIDGDSGNGSPDRVDALVWGLTELFPKLANRRKRQVDVKVPSAGGVF